MAIKRTEAGWIADFRINGRGTRRYRKTFNTKGEAQRYELYIKNKAFQDKEWNPDKPDNRRLSDLVFKWYELHGRSLKTGEDRKNMLLTICEEAGDPIARTFDSKAFIEFRSLKLEGSIGKMKVTENTVNHYLAYFRAIYNELERLGDWKHGNPLSTVKKIKIDEQELSYLTDQQVSILLDSLESRRDKNNAAIISKICLATGARWSEAEELRDSQISKYRITFARTKSGKARTVPIEKWLYNSIMQERRGVDSLFIPCYGVFRKACKDLKLNLPRGQLTHILRHTFASHFMMNGGDILTLQRVLGHQSLMMTMRYAHLAPDHLEKALRFNPISSIRENTEPP
ncbi:tyrosine-type recombinase/integrase [Endozoicomonas sp. SESOKO1]|uniref:phage integrase n=1 Tax=Endozoicomonas sp. SESOKO1 TaxID=2828742 RepID=UPI00214954C3|nr:tyrosine-type recombinase/integrase [Endozoicomonas sp. SESOKO1]